MSSEVIVVPPAFQLAMSILPGVNITSLQFSSPKGLPGVLRSYSSMVVKPLRQRFDCLSRTLFWTLLIHYGFSLRPLSFTFIQELRCNNQRCSLLTFECDTGVTSFAQIKLVGACHHCLKLESPRLGWRKKRITVKQYMNTLQQNCDLLKKNKKDEIDMIKSNRNF